MNSSWRAVAFAVVLAPLLAQCDRDREQPAPPPAPSTITPAPLAPMSRAMLIEAVTKAADVYSSGSAADESELAGQRFRIILPFGCQGALMPGPDDAADGLARWRWGEGNRSLRLTATAADWSKAPDLAPMFGTNASISLESAAGFWVPRPWRTGEDCPALRLAAPQPAAPAVAETADGSAGADEPGGNPILITPLAPPPSPQTVGLVQIFTDQSPRTGRTVGRPHVHTIRAEGDAPLAAPDQGFRLVLEGRIDRFPGGQSIRCSAPSPDVRPTCLVAVTFDRLAFRDPRSETALAEWR